MLGGRVLSFVLLRCCGGVTGVGGSPVSAGREVANPHGRRRTRRGAHLLAKRGYVSALLLVTCAAAS